jgi:hypothetical protein
MIWPNRDPIGEGESRNLYGFTENEPAGVVDSQGTSLFKGIREYLHTKPETERSRRQCTVKARCPEGWESEGVYHTHPSGPWWDFSYGPPPSDEHTAMFQGRVYLGVGRRKLGAVGRLDGWTAKPVPPIKVWPTGSIVW